MSSPASHHHQLEIRVGSQVRATMSAAVLAAEGPQAVLTQLAAADEQPSGFTPEELSTIADWAADPARAADFPVPVSPPPAAAAAAASPPRQQQQKKQTALPPGFPGYRWVAQTVALQSRRRCRPLVRLAHVYDFLSEAWPEHFPQDSGTAAAWKSGVRHAVRKYFVRVEGKGLGGGIWFQPVPEKLMTREEARKVVMMGEKRKRE